MTLFVAGRARYVHRLVMELVLGRSLHPREVVHHRDGNKLHNCPPNLEVQDIAWHAWQHKRTHPLVGYCEQCGEPYLQRRDHGTLSRFCTRACSNRFRAGSSAPSGSDRTRGRRHGLR